MEAVLVYLSIYSSSGFLEEPFFSFEFSNLYGTSYGRLFFGDRSYGVYSVSYFIISLRVYLSAPLSSIFCFSNSLSLCSFPKSGEHANFLFILGDRIVPASFYCNSETAYLANILRVDVLGPSLIPITFLGDPAFFFNLPDFVKSIYLY